MRLAVVLAMLLSCGKSGDRGLEAAAAMNTLEIHEPGMKIELDRHRGKHAFALRPLDREFIDASFVDEQTVDRFLRAVASERVADVDAPKQDHGAHDRVFVTLKRDDGKTIALEGDRKTKEWRANGNALARNPSPIDDAYEALLTSIGRPEPL